MSAGTPHMFAGSSPGLSAELSAGTSGSQVRFVSTGTHSWSRTNRTDKFFPMGCPLVRFGRQQPLDLVTDGPHRGTRADQGVDGTHIGRVPALRRPSGPAGEVHGSSGLPFTAGNQPLIDESGIVAREFVWKSESDVVFRVYDKDDVSLRLDAVAGPAR
jgi:hypothetical protein